MSLKGHKKIAVQREKNKSKKGGGGSSGAADRVQQKNLGVKRGIPGWPVRELIVYDKRGDRNVSEKEGGDT